MQLRIFIMVFISIIHLSSSNTWSFNLFATKDIDYYKQHKDEAKQKIEACEVAIWSAKGDVEAIEKIMNNSECIAADNALKFFRKQKAIEKEKLRKAKNKIEQKRYEDFVYKYSNYNLNQLDNIYEEKCGFGGLFHSKWSECSAIIQAKKNIYEQSINKLSLLTLQQLEEKLKNCSGNKFDSTSECSAVEKARQIVHKNELINMKHKLSSLSDHDILNLTHDPTSKCYSLNKMNLYCEAVRAIRKDRVGMYKQLYLNDDAMRARIHNKCNDEYKKMVKITGSLLLDNRNFSEPLKCIAASKARQLKGEDYMYYSR